MAEFIMKDKINKLGLSDKFVIASRATSYEEEGNDMHNGAKKMLDEMNISYTKHRAKRLEKDDYLKYDYFICMDSSNIRNINYIFADTNNKVFKLLDRDIADPWYTGNFIDTYNDLDEGIDLLIDRLVK
jgi:protein-tyrosine phosphatase